MRERHTMVFDGDWNGGERMFRVDPGEELELHSITRVDDTGAEHRLQEDSSLSQVDQYGWADSHHVRWRVRDPSDPPLQNRELTYVLDYTLRNILVRHRDGTFELDHNFAFANRPGDIERFSLRLELDPAWKATAHAALVVDNVALPRGRSYVVRIPLIHQGSAAPTSFVSGPSPFLWIGKVALLLLTLAAADLMLRRFTAQEASAGRYRAVSPTRDWLNEHVFSLRPEVVGTAWDHTTSDAEVSALLALMSLEGKVRQTRTGDNPELKLLVERDTLSSYEREFIDRLFIAGDTIDPATLRAHYKSTGFDPSTPLRLPLAHVAQGLVGTSTMWSSCAIGLGTWAVAMLAVPTAGRLVDGVGLQLVGYVAAAGMVAIAILGHSYHSRLRGPRAAHAIAIPAVVVAVLTAILAKGLIGAALFMTLALAMVWLGIYVGRWKGTGEHLQRLQNLAAARRFFQNALRRNDPSIEDHWIPYMLAFGLGPAVDQWSISAPGSTLRTMSSGTTSSSGESGSSFRGGGGGFGGAGATGGWATGLASFASSVPSPSSSSGSSSSGSSGGSSSGGGGGGGW